MRVDTIEMNKEIFKFFPSKETDIRKNILNTNIKGLQMEEIEISSTTSQEQKAEKEVNWYNTIPSFKQFVQYVADVNASGIDFGVSKYRVVNHWLPYYMSCNPCYKGTNFRGLF